MTAKRKIQILIDILMTVMLSACGKQSGEALDGQTENFGKNGDTGGE